MIVPKKDDYIDIHNHDVIKRQGVFCVDNIMAHEKRIPDLSSGMVYSIGIHPWFLTEDNFDSFLERVRLCSESSDIIAIGEAGFDKLRGPSMELQRKAFEAQVLIADKTEKPLFIHNVRAFDELMFEYKKLKPRSIWIVHGFQGKKELAQQLLSKGIYLSLWADFVLNRNADSIVKYIPRNRLFLETDAFDVDIRDIYLKVSAILEIQVIELKSIIYNNYRTVFGNINTNLE